MSSLQWLFFILANTIVVPLTVGSAFDLPPSEITGILRNSLIFTGIACMLQGLIGHRYPIMEGHSGIVWGLVLNLSVSATSMGMSLTTVGGGIATGMLLSGILVMILAACNLLRFLQRIITPMVKSVFLFLLTFQLILIFFKGMIKTSEDGLLDVPVTMFSVGVAVLVFLLKIKGRAIGNFSLLIGMAAGWGLYLVLFPSGQSISAVPSLFDISVFPLGKPNLNAGIIAVTFLACIVDLSNTMTTVQSAAGLFHEKQGIKGRLKRSFLLNGSFNTAASTLGLISYAPFASSIGFLESTQIFNRKPFLIGGGLMSLLGLMPFMSGVIGTMPITVGNAVLFATYMQLFGISLKSLEGKVFDSITIYRLAIPVLTGLGIMNADADLFRRLPVVLQSLAANGLIMGVLLSIALEMFIRWDRDSNSVGMPERPLRGALRFSRAGGLRRYYGRPNRTRDQDQSELQDGERDKSERPLHL